VLSGIAFTGAFPILGGMFGCNVGQIPSSKDVAREAGVSQSTVSFVLNERTDISISQQTRERVKRVARRLGYLPNRLARSMVSGRTQTIGVLVPRLDSTFCGGITQGIQEASSDHGYRVIIANTTQRSREKSIELECMLQHQVDGILCVACESIAPQLRGWIKRCTQSEVPFVVIDDGSHSDRADCIVSDDLTGAMLATTHLIQMGHRRIAHIAGSQSVSSGRERLAGYQTALKEADDFFDRTLILGNSYLQADTDASVESLLCRPQPPSAIFAANDMLAARVLRSLRKQSPKRPHHIAVVGYGNYAMGDFLELSTIDQRVLQMGKMAFERLLQRMHCPDLPIGLLRTPTELIARPSSLFRCS
jgi:DNA-binding LacI/PurR family transcriptional regulator